MFEHILPDVGEKSVGSIWHYVIETLFGHDSFYEYTIVSWGAFLLFVVAVLIVASKRSIRQFIIHHLMLCALTIFAAGTALYMVGFTWEGTACNPLALFLRAMLAAMEMFVSESELLEVAKEVKENPYYMMLFTLIHFLAVCVSAAFIIHIVGIRLISYFKMRFTWRNTKDLYVFFDLSQESVNLAKDIYKYHKGYPHKGKNLEATDNMGGDCKHKNGNFKIVFVKTPMEGGPLERFSFTSILNFADNRNEVIEDLISVDALLTFSRKSVALGMDQSEWRSTVGLSTLRRYVLRTSGKINFFCLSPNEENNVNTAVALSRRFDDLGKSCHVYCRADHDSVTDSFQDSNLTFVDSSDLAILELKKNIAYQPVSFVEPDTATGAATRPFRAMIVGFGETGFEALRFLYEFCAFVDKDGHENPFSFDIIDPQACMLEDKFYLHCPDVKRHAGHSITFHPGTVESNLTLAVELIKTVDYIIICTNSDKENLALGVTLLNLAYKHRDNSRKLSIFVGAYDNKEHGKAKEVADFYNKYGQQETSDDKLPPTSFQFTIIPFGARANLFTYKNIIDDEVLRRAKVFHYDYQKTSGWYDKSFKSDDMTAAINHEWDRNYKQPPKDSEYLCKKNMIMQKQFQDKANAWHADTKLCLAGVLDDDASERRRKLYDCINTVMNTLDRADVTDSYAFIQEEIGRYEKSHGIADGKYQRLFANLAKCEHLRWNASNRMLGYSTCEDTDWNEKHYLRKTLACMVTNEKLEQVKALRDTIRFDYVTLLASFYKKGY